MAVWLNSSKLQNKIRSIQNNSTTMAPNKNSQKFKTVQGTILKILQKFPVVPRPTIKKSFILSITYQQSQHIPYKCRNGTSFFLLVQAPQQYQYFSCGCSRAKYITNSCFGGCNVHKQRSQVLQRKRKPSRTKCSSRCLIIA